MSGSTVVQADNVMVSSAGFQIVSTLCGLVILVHACIASRLYRSAVPESRNSETDISLHRQVETDSTAKDTTDGRAPHPVDCTCPHYCYRCGRYPDGGPDGLVLDGLEGPDLNSVGEDSVQGGLDQRPPVPSYTFARTRVVPPQTGGAAGRRQTKGTLTRTVLGVQMALPVLLVGHQWSSVRWRVPSKREQDPTGPGRVDYMLLSRIVAVCGLCGAGMGVVVQGLLLLVGYQRRESRGDIRRPKGLHRR